MGKSRDMDVSKPWHAGEDAARIVMKTWNGETGTYSLTRDGMCVVSILNEQYSVQRSTELRMLAQPRSYTISADSGPEMLNSRSAYFFQYPKRRGNLSRNLS